MHRDSNLFIFGNDSQVIQDGINKDRVLLFMT